MFVILEVLQFSACISCDFCDLQVLNFFLTLGKAWLHVNTGESAQKLISDVFQLHRVLHGPVRTSLLLLVTPVERSF